jgi:hypothetical protein
MFDLDFTRKSLAIETFQQHSQDLDAERRERWAGAIHTLAGRGKRSADPEEKHRAANPPQTTTKSHGKLLLTVAGKKMTRPGLLVQPGLVGIVIGPMHR